MNKFTKILIMSSVSFISSCSAVKTAPSQNINPSQAAISHNKSAVQLHLIFDAQWQSDLKENPFTASYNGVKGSDHLLPSVTPEDYQRRLKQDLYYHGKLKKINRAALNHQDQINYDAFDFYMKHRISVAKFKKWRVPFLSDSGFFADMIYWSHSLTITHKKQGEDYIKRLKALPKYFEQNIANMRQGMVDGYTMPQEILPGIENIINSFAWKSAEKTPFFKPFISASNALSSTEKNRLQNEAIDVIKKDVIPAYAQFRKFFKNEYKAAARRTIGASNLPMGHEFYADQVKFFTTLNISAEEVHQIGLQEVSRIKSEMKDIIKAVKFKGSFAQFLNFLRTDPQFYAKTAKELLSEASYISKQIDGKLPGFFGKLPRQPYSVQPVPAELAPNYTGGRYSGAPLDAARGGEYWVNTYDLSKRPLYVLPALSLHEGVPGHHLQNALVKEMKNVPHFRKKMQAHAFGEGWGLYSEKLGVEMGIYKTPYEHFGRLTYEMWRACRLVVDTGMHVKGWSRAKATEYLKNNSAMSLREVVTEVDRYIAWPGQALAYKMGELKIIELRKRAEKALGQDFNIKEFHDTLLMNGSLPLILLERQIDRYIKSRTSH